MGAGENTPLGTRRAVTAGLTAGILFAPALVRAQSSAAGSKPDEAEPKPDSVLDARADDSDRMTVPVRLNGMGPFAFVVDTGSNRTVVSEVLASKLMLPASQTLRIRAATGIVDASSVRVATLTVGSRRLDDFDAPVLQAKNLGALGMLGIDAVASQRIVLDFRLKQMRIIPASAAEEDPDAIVVRARSRYGQLILVDTLIEGVEAFVILDTGGEITIANSVLRNALARRRASKSEVVTVTSVTGDTALADLSFLPRVQMGNIVISNVQVAYADLFAFHEFGLDNKPSMLLGMNVLRSFAKVSIDFPRREARFVLA